MPVQRKVFRIEEMMLDGDPAGGSLEHVLGAPQHNEIMAELRALRTMIGAHRPAAEPGRDNPELAAHVKMADLFNAQITEARKLKIELDVIDQAIKKTKGEMVSLQDHGLDGGQMARITQELAAVVTGTTEATDRILKSAETVEQSASLLTAALKSEHEIGLAQDIQDQVTQIFEACNFHDLTSQRITKVVMTLKQVEDHIAQMVEIWSAIERFTNYVARLAPPDDGESLLNGPKLDGDEGHSSQNDIDALFH
jgi:chemotaxis protein CheZ